MKPPKICQRYRHKTRSSLIQYMLKLSRHEIKYLIDIGVFPRVSDKITKSNYAKVLKEICTKLNCEVYDLPITFRSPGKLSKILYEEFLANDNNFGYFYDKDFINAKLCDNPKKKSPFNFVFNTLRKRLKDHGILIYSPNTTKYIAGTVLKTYLDKELQLDEKILVKRDREPTYANPQEVKRTNIRPKTRFKVFNRDVFDTTFKKMSTDKTLTLETIRVFHYLLGELSYENFLLIHQSDMAKELYIHRSQVSRSIKTLVEKGILIKGQKVMNTYVYRLSLDFGWKGSVQTYNENIKLSEKKTAKELAKLRWKQCQNEVLLMNKDRNTQTQKDGEKSH